MAPKKHTYSVNGWMNESKRQGATLVNIRNKEKNLHEDNNYSHFYVFYFLQLNDFRLKK